MTAKDADTLISLNEHCVMLTAMKLNTMKNANNPLNRDYNKKTKEQSVIWDSSTSATSYS